jgi:hypothetical protein
MLRDNSMVLLTSMSCNYSLIRLKAFISYGQDGVELVMLVNTREHHSMIKKKLLKNLRSYWDRRVVPIGTR